MIKNMDINQLTDWIDKYVIFENSAHGVWWDKKFCQQCESVKAMVQNFDSERECEFAWCELEHKCKFFQELPEEPNSKDIIKLWLEAEDEEV